MRRWGVFVVLSVGCSSGAATAPAPAPELPPFVSGSRLVARVFDGGGGAKQPAPWRDSKLGIDCTFRWASDFRLRCLPLSQGSRPSTCGDEAMLSTCGEGHYASLDIARRKGCLDPSEVVFSTSAAPQPPAGTVVCGVALDEDDRLVAVGPIAEPSTFVGATEVAVAASGGLAATKLVADDGAEQPWATRDVARGVDCAGQELGPTHPPGELRCVPLEMAWVWALYSDDRCMRMAAVQLAETNPCGRAAVAFRSAKAGPGSWFEIGDEIPVGELYQAGPCRPVDPSQAPPGRYFRVGAPSDPTSFPIVTVRSVGTGRLSAERQASSAGGALPDLAAGFVDHELGVACNAVRFSDGAYRCAPESTLVDSPTAFADASCTEPLYPSDAFVSDAVDGGCVGPSFVDAPGPVFEGASVYVRDSVGGPCKPEAGGAEGKFARRGKRADLALLELR